jgi:anti-anti-sigma factor
MQFMWNPHAAGIALVHLSERLDLLSAAEVKQRLTDLIAQGYTRLVVNLAQVSFIDSSGLGALISGLKAARVAGGDIRIAHPTEQVQSLLQLTALHKVLRPYETVDDALAAYQ